MISSHNVVDLRKIFLIKVPVGFRNSLPFHRLSAKPHQGRSSRGWLARYFVAVSQISSI